MKAISPTHADPLLAKWFAGHGIELIPDPRLKDPLLWECMNCCEFNHILLIRCTECGVRLPTDGELADWEASGVIVL